jgi:phospholipase C
MQKSISFLAVASLMGSLMSPPVIADESGAATATPIKHIVIIFGENISFDHYFGTYPNATNPSGEPGFQPTANTPTVNGLVGALLTSNPNFLNSGVNGAGAINPFRLDRTQAWTADQNHADLPEQEAVDHGLMDSFPHSVGTAGPPPSGGSVFSTTGLNLGYYDGNTVTALWNYAQHYALADNAYGSTYGPSSPGAINLISGQTNGILPADIMNGQSNSYEVADGNGEYTLVGDADPMGDVCSSPTRNQVQMSGKNIGDLLNSAGVTWGWFEGGFNLSTINPNGTTGCSRSTASPFITGLTSTDYVPHHSAFQYYASTANPKHTRPTSVASIGHAGDAGNHNYDINDFFTAVSAGNFPAVSFLKAAAIDDAHPGNSDPLDEQKFVVDTINFLEEQPDWNSTLVVIFYDDSDGWYDHQLAPVVSQSVSAADALSGPGACGSAANAWPGVSGPNAQGRCGYGPRIPMQVISPWAKVNFVDHSIHDHASIIHFIEDNWLSGARIGQGSFDATSNSIATMLDFSALPSECRLILDDTTGAPVRNLQPFGCGIGFSARIGLVR